MKAKLKKGNRVIVIKKINTWNEAYWVDEMSKGIGQTAIITGLYFTESCKLKFDKNNEDINDAFYWPLRGLKLLPNQLFLFEM